jgi:6-phosphofructokinase
VRRIGVLTGGGDAPGLNAVIRAIVLTARRSLGWEVVGIRDGFGGFVEAEGTMPLDDAAVRGLLWRAGSILGCNNLYRGDPKLFVERARELGLDALVIAGGDGSLTIAQRMAELGATVVGVPKTIDNDVVGTDVTFGFDTAVGVVAESCNRLIATAESHHRIMIVEVMGRHSGFIALYGAIAGAADVALIPEIPYLPERIVRVVNDRALKGRTYTLVVAAEGAVRAGGSPVVDAYRTRLTGREHLGGIGAIVAEELRSLVRHEVRSLALGHLQRGGMPTPFDRILGTRMGVAAVRALADGENGVYTAIRGNDLVLAPLRDAAGRTRRVARDDPVLAVARAVGISFGD